MDLNDPKQKELLARYQQQLMAQYQKKMLAQQKAKQQQQKAAAAAAAAAKQQPPPKPKPQHQPQHPASAQPVAPKRMARRSIDEGRHLPHSEQRPPAQRRRNSVAIAAVDQSALSSSSSSKDLAKRLNFDTSTQSTPLDAQVPQPDIGGTDSKHAEPSATASANTLSSSGSENDATSSTCPTALAEAMSASPNSNPARNETADADGSAMEEETSIEVTPESSAGGKRKFDEIRPEPTNVASSVDETDVEMEQADDAQTPTLAPPTSQAMSMDGKSPAKKRPRVVDTKSGSSISMFVEDATPSSSSEGLVAEVSKLKDENTQLMQQVKSLEELNASHSTEKDRLVKELDAYKESATKEVDSLRAEVTRLVDEMKSNSDDFEKTDASLKDTIASLENELASEREQRESDGASLKQTVEELEKALAEERYERASEVNDLRTDKTWLETLLEESKEKQAELARQSQKESSVKEEEMDTESAEVSELKSRIEQLSEKNASLEVRVKELSELGVDLHARPDLDQDTDMAISIETDHDAAGDRESLLAQLAEAREISQRLQDEAEAHARDIQQKDAMIISMGETVAQLRAKLENAADNEGPRSSSDMLLMAEKSAAETSEVSSQTNDAAGISGIHGTDEEMNSLKEELTRVREEMAATLVEYDELKTKFATVRAEYKTEIAALSNSYETELESLKCDSKTAANSNSVYSDEEQSVRKADMDALADHGGATQDDADAAATAQPKSAALFSTIDVENKIKLQYEQRLADFESQVAEYSTRVKALESNLQSKREEIQRLHQQIAVFSPDTVKEDSEPAGKDSPRERAPMSITARRFRQWVGGIELTFDPRREVLADFALRAARALHMAPTLSTERDLKSLDAVSSSMDLGEDTSPSDAAREPNKLQSSGGSLTPNSKYRLRRPGTEAEILSDASLKSFDVVYVTTAAEEALFGLASKEVAAHAMCMRSENSVGVICG